MARRASTDHSFVIGIDKPLGWSSHDVVSKCRYVFGERRCGHMGTLDPAATGALAVCVGPATRLNPLMTAHDKTYEFTIVFGSATDTDDTEGQVIKTSEVPESVFDEACAREYLAGIIGPAQQMPPVYSAIKVNGKKSYEAARNGGSVELSPRDIEIYSTHLVGIEEADGLPVWRVIASVSAGTYVRSIARDTGEAMGTCAHVGELRRLQAGNLTIENCVSISDLEEDPFACLLDPVKLLGLRFIFATERQGQLVADGRALRTKGIPLYRYDQGAARGQALHSCTSGIIETFEPLEDEENVCIVVDNKLKAIYQFDQKSHLLKSRCGFSVGVRRGGDI